MRKMRTSNNQKGIKEDNEREERVIIKLGTREER